MKFLYVVWRVLARRWLTTVLCQLTEHLRRLPPHGSLLFQHIAQLPSPRTKFDVEFYIWYTALGFKLLELSTGD